jgi:hypothetical protein
MMKFRICAIATPYSRKLFKKIPLTPAAVRGLPSRRTWKIATISPRTNTLVR